MRHAVKKIGTLVLSLALVLGLISASGITAVDTLADTTAMSTDTEYTVTISEGGGSQTYSFTPTEDGYYSFYTTGNYDTFSILYDADMNVIAEDDDGGASLNTRILYYLSSGATYYVEFSFYSSSQTGSFSAYAVKTEVSALTESEETSISLDGLGEGEYVYYSFTASADGWYELSLKTTVSEYDDESYCDVEMILYDDELNYLVSASTYSDSDDSGVDEGVSAWVLEAGKTYLVVFCYYGESPDSVTASISSAETTAISGSYTATASAGSYDLLYLTYTPSESGMYTFSFSSVNMSDLEDYACFSVEIYDSDFEYIGYASIYTYSNDSTDADTTLTAGETYYLLLYCYNENDEAAASATLSVTKQSAIDISGTGTYSISGSSKAYLCYTPSESGVYTFAVRASGSSTSCEAYAAVFTDAGGCTAGMYYEAYTYNGETYDYGGSYDKSVVLVAGTTYYIVFEGYDYDSAFETFTLTVSQDSSSVIDISESGSYTFTLESDEDGFEYEDKDYILKYTASSAGSYTVTLSGTSDEDYSYFWASCYVVNESTGEIIEEEYLYSYGYEGDSDSDSITFDLSANETIYIMLSEEMEAEDGAEATVTVTVTSNHTHTYDEGVVTEPTCTEAGYTTYTCSGCGSTYVTDYVAATGHTLVYVEGVAATCTEAGTEAYYKCSVCGALFADENAVVSLDEVPVIEALGHDYEADYANSTATCTEAGYVTYVCSRCGDTYSEEVSEGLGHDWSLVSNTATCEEEGIATYVCVRPTSTGTCGETKTETSEALGHDYQISETVEPTCTEAGSVTYVCANDSSHTYTEEVAATGHNLIYVEEVSATCEENGTAAYYYCATCGIMFADADATEEIDAAVVIPATGHTIVAVDAVDATCTTAGNIAYYTCSVCGKLFADEEGTTELTSADVTIAAPGHIWDSGVTNSDGSITYTCTVCGETYTKAASTSTDTDSDSSVDSADTSDAFPMGSLLAMLLAAGCAALLLLRRRAH